MHDLNPVVCFDESNKQLVAEIIEPLPIEPGQPERYVNFWSAYSSKSGHFCGKSTVIPGLMEEGLLEFRLNSIFKATTLTQQGF